MPETHIYQPALALCLAVIGYFLVQLHKDYKKTASKIEEVQKSLYELQVSISKNYISEGDLKVAKETMKDHAVLLVAQCRAFNQHQCNGLNHGNS